MYTIYGKPNCSNCEIAKSILRNEPFEFVYKDIFKNSDDFNFIKNSGAKSVPMIYKGDRLIGGVVELRQHLEKLDDVATS